MQAVQEILHSRGLVYFCGNIEIFPLLNLTKTFQNGNGYDYEDLLNQKRRDEARYRQGGQQSSGNLRSANSDGFLNSQSYGTSGGFNEQLEDLSQAVSSKTANCLLISI